MSARFVIVPPGTAAKRSRAGKVARAKGAQAETAVLSLLFRLGIFADILETGWHIRRKGKKIVSATPKKKVLGDIVGVTASGRGVLVESKAYDDDAMSLSKLDDHQRLNLDRWSGNNGLAFVAWVRTIAGVQTIFLIRWPAPIWRVGFPLPWAQACRLHQETMETFK